MCAVHDSAEMHKPYPTLAPTKLPPNTHIHAHNTHTHIQMGLKFPPEGDESAAEAHVISSLRAPMGHMILAGVGVVVGFTCDGVVCI